MIYSKQKEATRPVKWHSIETIEILQELKSTISGLTETDAKQRLIEHGPNQVSAKREISKLKIFIDQFRNYLVLILLGAATISVALNHLVDGIAIYVIVLFAVVLGFFQEYKADKAIEALLEITAPHATVIREGQVIEIVATEVVIGDIILLGVGDKIPADARLIEVYNLQVNEAPLTGEFVPVTKNVQVIKDVDAVADQINMVFAGTTVVFGRGKAVVVKTGTDTEFGKIAQQLDGIVKEETPMQKQIDRLGKVLTIVSLGIISIVFAVGLLQGEDPVEMFIWSISLAVAVVPEALPAIITISLAIGVEKMSKKNALVRRLPAVETLGSTTIICSDKTGTITEGKMQIKEVILGNKYMGDLSTKQFNVKHLDLMIQASNLCNDLEVNGNGEKGEYIGNPTEIAIQQFIDNLKHPYITAERVDEIPFSSERKMMSTVNKIDGEYYVFTKGAPEKILQRSKKIMIDGNTLDLTSTIVSELNSVIKRMGSDALRSIAIAYKKVTHIDTKEDIENELTMLGIYGLNDPPKSTVRDTILECRNVGIRTIMITGDQLNTANAIAKEVGILQENGIALQGTELDLLSDAELADKIDDIDVLARVSPSHKLRLVNALKTKGHIVAMTGDGINDAPALKAADVGVAMGSGTAVSKEAADMVLADDSFETIVDAIKEGRLIYDNIKKYLMFLLSSNLGEILLLTIAIFSGIGMPILAIHILYINLASDGLPALALAFDPATDKKLTTKPRDPNESVFTKPVIKLLVLGGVASAIINIGLFLFAMHVLLLPIEQAQIIVFVNLVLIQFIKAYSFRSDVQSITYYKPFTNKWLNIAVVWEIVLLLIIIYNDTMQNIFNTYDFTLLEWSMILISAFMILPILEFGKWFFVRSKKNAVIK